MSDTDSIPKTSEAAPAAAPAAVLAAVADAAARMRFGSIQLTVHEGKIVQLEVTEKRRFT